MKTERIEELQGQSVEVLELILRQNDDQTLLSMKISSQGKQKLLYFHNILNLKINNWCYPFAIYGFEIRCNKDKGWDGSSRYSVRDFEDDHISFSCENVEMFEI